MKGFQVNGSQEGGTRGAPCPLRGAVRCSAVQCGTVRCDAVRCGSTEGRTGTGTSPGPLLLLLLLHAADKAHLFIYLFIYLLSCPSRLSPVEKIYILTSV